MVPLWGGVDLFFVLSGFLITGILLRTRTNENYFSSFYARRILRIFPVYYLALSLSLIAGRFSPALGSLLPHALSSRLAYFIYLQNWPVFWHGAKTMEGVWGAYWSLAVEEQFYFLWPLVIIVFSPRVLSKICLGALLPALALRIILNDLYFHDKFGLVQITSSRIDGLFLGAACAIYMARYKRPVPMKWIRISAYAGAMIMGFILLFHPWELANPGKWILTFGITGFGLLSMALVAVSQHHIPAVQRVLTLKVLRVAGKYSYGMYVYHLFVFLPFRDYWKNRLHSNNGLSFPIQLLMMLIEVVVVFVIAKLSYDLFETRFLLLKKYFEPAPRIAPAVTQSQILR